MLSVFPSILFLAPFSAFLIRIVLSVVLASAAWRHLNGTTRGDVSANENIFRIFGVFETIAAASILVGLYTQVAAIVGGVLILIWLTVPQYRPTQKGTAILSLVLCLSLLLTGAGPFAFDLPL